MKSPLFQVIKVWDLDTGNLVFEFGGAHGPSAITCMTFDPQGRRCVSAFFILFTFSENELFPI